MEMSVGTIVTIVLLVSVLILGIFLISRIRESATGVIDMTNDAVVKEVNKLFAEPQRVVIFPNTKILSITQGKSDEVGIYITHLKEGVGTEKFSYEVTLSDKGNCVETEEQILRWIVLGKAGTNIDLSPGTGSLERIRFQIPTGTSICTARFRVSVSDSVGAYGTDSFDIEVE